jgi:CelD/BcsL family acetyltransferase involved in cellulose biosynthesis
MPATVESNTGEQYSPDENVLPTLDAVAGPLSFDIVEEEKDLHALELDWNSIFLQQKNKLSEQSFARALAAWETVGRPKARKLFIIVGRVRGRVVLIFPLSVQTFGPIQIARGLGPEFYEYCDMLVSPDAGHEAWVADAWDLAASQFDILRFPAIRATAHLWRHVEKTRSARWNPISVPYVNCREWTNWDDYLRSRSSGFRQDHRRSIKRLEKEGHLQWVVVDESHRLSDALNWMIDRKLAWLAGNGKETATLASKREFYLAHCRMRLNAGDLVLIELLVNDQRVAAQFGFCTGGRLDCEMIAWDDAWKEFGPGRVLAVETIRWAFENSCEIVELGVFGSEFKSRFTDEAASAGFHVFVASGLGGRILLEGRELTRALKGSFDRATAEFWKTRLKSLASRGFE